MARSKQPREGLASQEQKRADGLSRKLISLASQEAPATDRVVWQAAYQDASTHAAANTSQLRTGWRFGR